VQPDQDRLEVLSPDECVRLLRTRSFGRIGLSADALPVVLPVNYVVVDHSVVIRTGKGTRLSAAARNAIVAFEVDDVDRESGLEWSVMIQGLATETTARTCAQIADAPELARWIDAVGNRHFSISVDRISGRRLRAPGPLPRRVAAVHAGQEPG
jgi:nitroimidazol reductase NimA-like FMN-containing flavoprotein (pyridoxamine 5'-phosphate oxidase superfamily)